ncbi:MAG: Zn-dependent oxidoreductase, NADPH:quinone reductase, partial [Pseudonocardiales bacterium]|nr:Zn-dependent oxidoreductase, NADPH:quinone reductase [Pseudonocardiales bacterium]
MRAIQITEFGGPETLTVSDVPDPIAADGQDVLDVLAAGVNYADTHQTENSYISQQTLPLIP